MTIRYTLTEVQSLQILKLKAEYSLTEASLQIVKSKAQLDLITD